MACWGFKHFHCYHRLLSWNTCWTNPRLLALQMSKGHCQYPLKTLVPISNIVFPKIFLNLSTSLQIVLWQCCTCTSVVMSLVHRSPWWSDHLSSPHHQTARFSMTQAHSLLWKPGAHHHDSHVGLPPPFLSCKQNTTLIWRGYLSIKINCGQSWKSDFYFLNICFLCFPSSY